MKLLDDLLGFIKTHKIKIVAVSLIFVTVTGIAYWTFFYEIQNNELSKNNQFKEESADTKYSLLEVKKEKVGEQFEVMGQIIFKEKVNVSSKVSGRLNKIYIEEGKNVKRGQLIAEMERLTLQIQLKQQKSELEISKRNAELSKAKYENALKAVDIKLKTINKAKADLNDKKVTYENMNNILKNKMILHKAGGISRSEIKSLKTQHTTLYTKYELAKADYEIQQVGYTDRDIKSSGYKVPKSRWKRVKILKRINTKIERAELGAARSRVGQARNNLRSTKLLLNETYIRSPLNGVVASKNMEAGEMVKADSTIATIMDISQVYLSMNINEKEIKTIHKGQSVVFTADAIGKEKEFNGKITRITPILDPKSRTVEIKALVKNYKKILLPGMFARAQIKIGKDKDRLMIPISSIISKEKENANIYVVKKDTVFKIKVKLGMELKERIEVTDGLNPGDVIISKNINTVYAGMKIPNNVTNK